MTTKQTWLMLGQIVAIVTMWSGMGGCGTQTGNPPASDGPSKLATMSPAEVSAMMSLAYTETIDGLNTGDYLFSNSESRVINQLSCQSAETGLGLVKLTDTQHSVRVQAADRESVAALSISRSYRDQWFAENTLVDCNPISANPDIDPERLADGDGLRLQTELQERKQRDLAASLRLATGEISERQQMTLVEKSGQRALDFTLVSHDATSSHWHGVLQDQLSRQIKLGDDRLDDTLSFSMQADQSPVTFDFIIDRTFGLISEYRMESQTVIFQVADQGTLTVTYSDLILVPASGCFPISGQMQAVWQINGQKTEAEWRFEDGLIQPSAATAAAGLMLFPEACVLDER